MDVGSGPTLYQVLSGCEVFDKVLLTDFLEVNRQELRRWLQDGGGSSLDWTPYLQHVCQLEGRRYDRVPLGHLVILSCDRHVTRCIQTKEFYLMVYRNSIPPNVESMEALNLRISEFKDSRSNPQQYVCLEGACHPSAKSPSCKTASFSDRR